MVESEIMPVLFLTPPNPPLHILLSLLLKGGGEGHRPGGEGNGGSSPSKGRYEAVWICLLALPLNEVRKTPCRLLIFFSLFSRGLVRFLVTSTSLLFLVIPVQPDVFSLEVMMRQRFFSPSDHCAFY